MKKVKTYMDRLMGGKEFREKFEQEYQNLCIGEQIVRALIIISAVFRFLTKYYWDNKA